MKMRGIAASILFFVGTLTAMAEPVAIKGALGQGLLVNFRGNCFVIFPSHVDKSSTFIRMNTAAPQAVGNGFVYFRRTEADLAVASVGGSASKRCNLRWSSLPADVGRLLSRNRRAVLERINAQGAIERIPMRIDRVAWEAPPHGIDDEDKVLFPYIIASLEAGETRELFQGVSGAFLYVDGTPVGMTVAAPDERTVRALRIEEITGPVGRWLTNATFGAAEKPVPQQREAIADVPFVITEWNADATAEEFHVKGLETGANVFRASLLNGPVFFVAELAEGVLVPLRSISISGPGEGSPAAVPRFIRVEVDRSRRGLPDWDEVWTGNLLLEGGDKSIPLSTFARRVRITVLANWDGSDRFEVGNVQFFAEN